MLKQRPTLNQGLTQSGRTRRQNREAVMGVSDDRASCGKLLLAVLFLVSPGG